MRRISAAVLVTALSVVASAAHAQEPPVLAPDAPLTLRPVPRLARLAGAVARTLALRMDVAVSVGDAPPPGLLEAVPSGHVALGRDGGTILLVLAGPEGQVFHGDVPIGREGGSSAVRAVALAIEALRDAALDGPPAGASPTSTRRTFERDGQVVTWIYREREGGLFGPRQPPVAEAKPAFYLGASFGLATERLNGMVGARLGLALCLHEGCLALEGDVPVLPQESQACDGRQLQYRPVSLGLRFSMRPLNVDDVIFFGFSAGVLTRFGTVNLVGVDVSRLATDFGLRGGLEVAWRFAAPVELGVEIGGDFHVSPARFTRASRPLPGVDCPTIETVLVEDLVTLWAALVVRVRP